jgi:hypothetical protein
MKFFAFTAAFFFFCGTLLVTAAVDDPAASLLSNGHFETDTNSANWPDGWPHPDGTTWEKEDAIHFLRLQSSKPGQMILLYRQITLATPPPPALEIRLRVRYANIKAGEKPWFDGRVIAHFKNEAGRVVKPEPSTPAFRGTSKGWVDHSYFVKVPAHARAFEIMPCLFQPASGTLDIAQCEVFAASADKLPVPPPIIPSATFAPTTNSASLPKSLHVVGNRLQTVEGGNNVWLQGLCVDSLEWSAAGEKIQQSIPVAIEQWKANVIRLPVNEDFWFGRKGKKDGGLGYRKVVDAAIEAAGSRGAYVALDLHRFGAPMPQHAEFWKDAATRYKNHPAVLLELFNEAHGISWKTWRDGGPLHPAGEKQKDANAAENDEEEGGEVSVGMQALVNAIRSTGAHNPIIAGGLDWGYDLSGITQGYALEDRDGGQGIIYSSHIYPWKKDWQNKVLTAAAKYPIFVGEIGCPLERMPFIPPSQHEDPYTWAPDALGLIQKYQLNWTAFSFHPKSAPMVISDWQYTPTPYWGAFVKEALGGKAFVMGKMR